MKGKTVSSLKHHYQNVFRRYEEEHGHQPATARQVAKWGVEKKLLKPRPVDPLSRLASELSEALGDEKGFDGHRKNLARRAKVNGQLTMLWGRIDEQPREFVEAAVQDWRKQIAGECVVVARTLEYRQKIRPKEEQISFSYNFDHDVTEELLADDQDDAA